MTALRRAADAGQPFSLVLLDAMMPDIDGFEVARQCKADSALAGATIMMLSSADCDDDAARCKAVGMASYLRKPVTPAELHDAIVTVLGLHGPPTDAASR